MKISKEQVNKIEDYCLEFYRGLDFAHNEEHMYRTIEIAEHIARAEGANLLEVRIGAMVHQFHSDDNISKLKLFLVEIGLDKGAIQRLMEFVEFSPYKGKFVANPSIEAKVVFDADALQCSGPQGVLREVACNIKARGKSLQESIQRAREVENVSYSYLQTKIAKGLIEDAHSLMKDFWKMYDELEKIFPEEGRGGRDGRG